METLQLPLELYDLVSDPEIRRAVSTPDHRRAERALCRLYAAAGLAEPCG